MSVYIADKWEDYEVLDTGDGEKLERWADILLRRPDPQVLWPARKPEIWKKADAVYHRSDKGGGEWEFRRPLPESWQIGYRDLRFRVHPTNFKHTGLFPEQAVNWDWMRSIVEKRVQQGGDFRVLNLFGYTGGATVALLRAGAQLVHVDAAKGMVNWAKENAALSLLADKPCRWIVEDCLKFVQREIRRGNTYQGILMDPPSYGRGPGGEIWKLEQEIYPLVEAAAQILAKDAGFFLINSYTTGLQSVVLRNLLEYCVAARRGGEASSGEIALPVRAGGLLPCGASGRWKASK